MLIGETLASHARSNPDGLALVFAGRRLTWKALDDGANRFANALTALGARKGERVLFLVDNSVEWVEIYYGLAKIGCLSAPVMARSVGSEIAYIANDLDAGYVVVQADSADIVNDVLAGMPTIRHVIGVGEGHGLDLDYHALVADAQADAPGVAVDTHDDLTVKYTSGTTGLPKGCLRTHYNFVMASLVALAHQPVEDDDIASITSPLAAGMAVSELVRYVMRGTPMVMLGRFDAKEYMELIARERITIGYAMETMKRRLILHPDFPAADLSSLRSFSGSPPGEETDRFLANKSFTGGFHGGYGSSEAGGRVSFMSEADYRAEIEAGPDAPLTGSLGRPGILYRMECVDDDLEPVPQGEIGELAIHGPSVFKGYWGKPEETAKVLRDGWLLTGDLACKDARGHIFLRGRKRDMIKTGGVNVYPAEIEPVLAAHPSVAEVSVVGVPDAEWGEKVVACVVARAPVAEDELIGWCRDKLAAYKRPKQVAFFDTLPSNASGKVVKRDLQRMLSEGAGSVAAAGE